MELPEQLIELRGHAQVYVGVNFLNLLQVKVQFIIKC
jgi:hypothetical protein